MENSMKLIHSGEKLVSYLSGDNSLLDGEIEKFEVYSKDFVVQVDIHMEMRPSSEFKKILVRFSGCKEYCFYFNDSHYFYNVERVKFFQNEEKYFYVSFDPYDELEVCNEDDQDIILAKEVSAYVLDS